MGRGYREVKRLTFAELEALASLGTTGFLTLDGTGVASHEAVLAQQSLVLGVDFHESASDGEAECFSLTLVATTIEIYVDVVFLGDFEERQGLLNDKLKNRRGEVYFQGAFVDGDGAVTFLEDNTSHSGFAATYCIYCFHIFRLFHFVDVNDFGVLSLMGMLRTVVHVHVLDEATAKTVLGEHAFHHMNKQGVNAGLEVLVEGLLHEHFGSGFTLTTGIAGEREIHMVGHLLAGEFHLVGVNDDHIVTTLGVRGVRGLILTAKNFSHLRAQTAEGLVGGIDEDPLVLDSLSVGRYGFVA